jgi:indole-3-glycerol phosphate synthase
MNILNQIAADKKREVQLKKKWVSENELTRTKLFTEPTRSLRSSLKSKNYGIIAEHKRRSPSKSVINQKLALPEVVCGYEQAGAGGISVLTDGTYFGGSLEDLLLARTCTQLPLLRKEFIIDPYQIMEAKAYGADAILLIAALLNREEIKEFTTLAHELGLEVLMEVHSKEELENALIPELDMLGVNNRNLKTFEVSLDISRELSGLIPADMLKISESGLASYRELQDLKRIGYNGFLMGEAFMKEADPGAALNTLLNQCSHEA